jgi:hypothetical protein
MSKILRKVATALFIGTISLLMFLSMVSTARAQIALTPKEDSTVTSCMPDINEGDLQILYVEWDSCERWAYLKFDLSELSPGSVTDAVLWLFCTDDGSVPAAIDVDVCEASCEWTEYTITWNNKPVSDPGVVLATTAVDGSSKWYKWQSEALTAYVNAHTGGDMCLIVKLPVEEIETNLKGFFSREWPLSPPLLSINPPSIGGFDIPVNKFALLAPYMASVSVIAVGAAVTVVYMKRRKER